MAQPHPFFLVLMLQLLCTMSLHAASVYSHTTLRAHQEYLKLRIAAGQQLTKQDLKQNAVNAAALLVANYGDFLTLCVQQDATAYEALLQNQENRLSQIEALKENSAWKRYAQAEVRMQIGVSKILFGNKLSAAWDIRQAYLQYTSLAKQHPDFIPNKKTLGVLQVLIGSVPDNYRWFLNIIGMKGSINSGLANLRSAATKENPFQDEAKVIYALTLQVVDQQNEKQALRILENAVSQHPDNLLYRFAVVHALKKAKQSEQALKYYRSRPISSQYLLFPYLQHMAADLYLYRGDFDESVAQNTAFLKQHKGKHYVKAAHFKLHLAYYLSNHHPQALWHYNKVSEVGSQEIEEDKYAAKYVLKQEKAHKPLLLARLKSDGGYYREALAAIKTLDTTQVSLPVKAEYTYRSARIYHGLQDATQAIKLYKNTIAVCAGTDLYFAPHAALQLGYLYKEQQQEALAKVYFNKAISYKDYEYKNSIDAKAKLALATLQP
ncbi:tetratricopeptide repeat protein [uncultured Pontibacter sp.]|uniref:tetratricopeptide repeat protein n=1 Tax=uncultured Pontibacter sp. TaxID=453356 RepID=UPI0026127184|nr:tetratricopeptide repeat protein [uncultured Pontibacter sp.]